MNFWSPLCKARKRHSLKCILNGYCDANLIRIAFTEPLMIAKCSFTTFSTCFGKESLRAWWPNNHSWQHNTIIDSHCPSGQSCLTICVKKGVAIRMGIDHRRSLLAEWNKSSLNSLNIAGIWYIFFDIQVDKQVVRKKMFWSQSKLITNPNKNMSLTVLEFLDLSQKLIFIKIK